MTRRIVIIGGPRVGKSTLAEKLKAQCGISNVHTSHDLEYLDWSAGSEFASQWFSEDGDWIVEGVQMARALRKWLRANPEKPLDVDILRLNHPFETLLKGQESMTKGIETVFSEIQGELGKRGARIHYLRDPGEAIDLFLPVGYREADGGGMPKFKLKAKVAKLDDVQEAYRPVYVEKDGEFYLDPVKLETVELDDPKELSDTLRKEREAKALVEKDLKAERDKYKDYDPVKYAELMAKAQEAEENDLKAKGKVDELLDNQRQKYEKIISDLKTKYEAEAVTLNTQLDEVIIDASLRSAYEKAGVIPDRIDAAIKLTRDKAQRKDGKMLLLDDNGTVLDMSPENYAKELVKTNMPFLFQPTANGGTGAAGGTGANGGKPTKTIAEWKSMTPDESTAFFKSGGTLVE